jgi:hypothetical protein
MNTKLLAASILLATAGWASAQAPQRPEPEHTIWVRIESTPPLVDLYATPEEGKPLSRKLGTTPCVVAVDLTWGYKWFKKRWEMISVWSPGDSCEHERTADNGYDLTLKLTAVKEGFENGQLGIRFATLKFPGKDWSGQASWPSEANVAITLTPKGGKSGERAELRPLSARKVIIADGGGTLDSVNSGTLSVSANVEAADVFVDDQYVGVAPIQLVLKDGSHIVQVQKQGYKPLRRSVHVDSDIEVKFHAVLPQ